ncbi:chemotaxis-specific protein-glutamate methyltransferase CheB [Deferrisoma camini]|uniref:chemotaxis-specific protein-glutamate methyltransferase CheB n=1 Tax=Deferrisoma camini TaxID=1035120 RepID=UPI00046D75BC|nr:chemotaxis-specific protein-glutamate methyltransferase CheB [Deferrisoma camini]
MGARYKVLVVDDSALMRKYLRQMLETQEDFEVYTARDGEDALRRIQEVDPDVVSLDINMPVMDGLTCLSHIMTESPRPVVMVSSLTEKGALATFEALELGAVDYLAKPDGTVSLQIKDQADELIRKVRAALGAKRRPRRSSGERVHPPPERLRKPLAAPEPAERAPEGLVLIGVSTGGPRTLEEILPDLPADFPLPALVAQHMPGHFTRVFAERLDRRCALRVKEIRGPSLLEAGTVWIARGDADVVLSRRRKGLVALGVPADERCLWHPSVDRMVRSALEHVPADRLIAVELTGMGDDGAEAMAEVHRRGGRTVAESEDTAVVFGMPKELIERGGADKVLPCHRIARQLVQWAYEGSGTAEAAKG